MGDVRAWFSLVEQHNYNGVRAVQRKYAGTRNDDGCTALMLAVKNNDLTMVEVLSETESGFVNNRDETALFLACARNYDDIASVLIPKERELRQSSTGYTPLIIAAANGSTRVIPLLIPYFGNETDKQGYTALDYATYNNYHLCVDLLTKSEKFSVPDLERAVKIAEECGHVQLHTKLTAHLLHKVKTLGDRATLAATSSKSPFTSPGAKQYTTSVNRFSNVSPSQHTDKLGKVESPNSTSGAPKKGSPALPVEKSPQSFGRATSTLKAANKMALNDPPIGSVIPPLSDLGEIFRRNLAMRNKSVRSAYGVTNNATANDSAAGKSGIPSNHNDIEMQIIHRMTKMGMHDRDDEDGVILMHQNPENLKHIKPRAQSNRIIPRPTYLLSPEHDTAETQITGPRSDALTSDPASHVSTVPGTELQSCTMHQARMDLIPEETYQDDNLIPPVIMDSYQNELGTIQRSGAAEASAVGRSTSVIGLPLSPTANIDTASTLKKISKMSATELRVACVEMLECIEGKERLINKFLETPTTAGAAETSSKPRLPADAADSFQYTELLSSCDKYRSQAIDLQSKLDTVADVMLTRSSQVYDILYQILKAISITGNAAQWVTNTTEAQQKSIEGLSHVADLCNKIWSTHSAMLEDVKSADSALVREANRLLRKDSLTSGIVLPSLSDLAPLAAPPPETADMEVEAAAYCSDSAVQTDLLLPPSADFHETIDRLASVAESPLESNQHTPIQIKPLKEEEVTPQTPKSNVHHHSEDATTDEAHKDNAIAAKESVEEHDHHDAPSTVDAPKTHTPLVTKEAAESANTKSREIVKPTNLKLDENGNSTVMRAIKKILKLDPYKVGDDGRSMSSRAHQLTDEEQAKLTKLFEEVKKDIKKQAGHENNDGYTALMMAAGGNNIELIKILLPYEAGIRVLDDKDFIDNTATKIALLNGNTEAASLLLGPEGFEIQPPDVSGGRKTELMDAAEQGDVVSVYLYAPSQATLVDEEGKTALMYAASAGKVKVLQYLKAEAKMATSSGTTAMMLAGMHGHHDCCKYLLEFERGMTDKHKMTALMHAASQGHRPCVEALIKEVGAKTKEGMNALMYAIQVGSKPCIEYILRKYPKEKTVTTTEKSKYGAGCTPADVAVKAGHPELVALLE